MPKAADFPAIYGIRHIASGRIYVGSAVRTNARWRQHRSQLQRGTHHSRYLQAAWSKYGAEDFEFVVLEIVPTPDELLVRENEWISSSMAADRRYGFNCCPVAGSGFNDGPGLSPGAYLLLSAANKSANPCLGYIKTPERKYSCSWLRYRTVS